MKDNSNGLASLASIIFYLCLRRPGVKEGRVEVKKGRRVEQKLFINKKVLGMFHGHVRMSLT
jgi:hypothetical protein